MYLSRRAAVAMLRTAALAGSATTAVTALARPRGHDQGNGHRMDGDRLVLSTSLAPSVPTDRTLLGATAIETRSARAASPGPLARASDHAAAAARGSARSRGRAPLSRRDPRGSLPSVWTQ